MRSRASAWFLCFVRVGQPPRTPSVLHRIMDAVCSKIFVEACMENPHFCVSAVARRDVGSAEQVGTAWRCYSTKELDYTLAKKGCVDDCGELVECLGSVPGTSLEHLSHTEELNAEIESLREGTCKIHVGGFL